MWNLVAYIFLFWTISVTSADDHVNYESSLELLEKSQKLSIISAGYETGGTPAFLRQTWNIKLHDDVDDTNRIKLECDDIRLYDTNPCDEWKFVIENGNNKDTLCGSHYNLKRTSSGRTLKLSLSNEKWGGVFVKCWVSLVSSDPISGNSGIEVTTKKYYEFDYEEIDSSEFGVKAGLKNTTCPCGWTNKNGNSYSRILNGVEAAKHEYPFIVAITEQHDDWGFCGGSILTHYHVLTAAHCTAGFQASRMSIVVGRHVRRQYTSNVTKKIDVARIIDYPGNLGIRLHDISILVLKKSIPFNQYVGPICLFNNQPDLTNQWTKVMGWGSQRLMAEGHVRLQKVNTRITHVNVCESTFGWVTNQGVVTKICAHATLNKGACSGDSGGPLVWLDPETNRYSQVGVVSAGYACGGTAPTLYTRVQAYNDWIKRTIQASHPNEMSCHKVE